MTARARVGLTVLFVALLAMLLAASLEAAANPGLNGLEVLVIPGLLVALFATAHHLESGPRS